MTGYIYKYENQINHKVYIGQTLDPVKRTAWHKADAKRNKNNKFYNAVNKYGWDAFDYAIIAQVEAEDIDTIIPLLDSLEEQYITQYNSFYAGYNSTTGGHSYRHSQMPEGYSEECRQRAKNYPRERIEKLQEGRRNYTITDEHRKRLSDIAKERNFAAYRELTTEKRNAGIRRAKSKGVLQLDQDGNIVNEFETIQDAVNYIIENYAPDRKLRGIWKGIYRHFNGITKKRLYYGFEWKLKSVV